MKAYLYDLLLKVLQQFDEQQSIEYRLNHFLQSIAVLFKRGHYQDCHELLLKANRLASKYESFTHLLDLIRWEKQLAYTRMDADFFYRELDRLVYEEKQALRLMDNVAAYRRAFFTIYASVKKDAQLRDEVLLHRLNDLLADPIFDNPDQALSHKARVFYYRTLNLYYYTVQNQEAFYESGQQLIALLESQPHFLQESLSDYIAGLSNFILSCGLQGKYDEVRSSLQKLHQLKPITADDRQKIHRQYYSNYFMLCIDTGDFAGARTLMESYLEKSKALESQPQESVSFYFSFCYICFGCGEFSSALDYLNQWLSQPRTVEREDLQSLARIMALIIHFELGNTVLLDSLLRSATRFMQKKNRLFDLERRFMQLMSELMKATGSREEIAALSKTREDLRPLAKMPATQALLQTFDLDAWLQSRIMGSSFATVVQIKWQEQHQKP
ncbi:MAG: hypothetical protein IPL65_02570 [Lewinellaceae bacterium]|nr:hypothetical protein [Lewinellaceae bacterium]